MRIISNNQLALLLLLAVSLFTQGCSTIFKPRQSLPTSTYLLEMPENTGRRNPVDNGSCLTLLVRPTAAAPGFNTSRIAYLRKDYQLEYFAYHQWVDKPANMLTPILVQALEQSRLFSVVVTAPSPLTMDLRLDSELLSLQQIFGEAGSELQLKLRVVLFHRQDKKILASHIFSIVEPTTEDTPYGAVLAANRAVAQLLHELVEFIDMNVRGYALQCSS